MKTTIYELLGMVKDGKAPKKIKFNEIYCYYRECKNEYVDYTDNPIIQWDYVVMNSLNDEVEILEEPKEIPEKLKIEQDTPSSNYYIKNEYGTKCALTKHSKIIADKVNELLDYLESKGE